MWSKKTKIFYVLYQMTAGWLPETRHFGPGGRLRTFWAKKICRHCGKNVNIERHARFTPGLSIGNNSGVGIDCELWGNVSVGQNVMMGPEVIVYTQNHASDRTDIPMGQQGHQTEKPVVIGDDVWLGRRVMVLPGVHIGNGCIVGAGAVVTRDIPDYAVAGGVPAKVLKFRKPVQE